MNITYCGNDSEGYTFAFVRGHVDKIQMISALGKDGYLDAENPPSPEDVKHKWLREVPENEIPDGYSAWYCMCDRDNHDAFAATVWDM